VTRPADGGVWVTDSFCYGDPEVRRAAKTKIANPAAGRPVPQLDIPNAAAAKGNGLTLLSERQSWGLYIGSSRMQSPQRLKKRDMSAPGANWAPLEALSW